MTTYICMYIGAVSRTRLSSTGTLVYLAHKKLPPPRTLQWYYA